MPLVNFFDALITALSASATASHSYSLVEATNTGGIIQSSKTSSYSNNMDLWWRISSNVLLELAFISFTTEKSNMLKCTMVDDHRPILLLTNLVDLLCLRPLQVYPTSFT